MLKTKLTTFHSLTPFNVDIIDREQSIKLKFEARDSVGKKLPGMHEASSLIPNTVLTRHDDAPLEFHAVRK